MAIELGNSRITRRKLLRLAGVGAGVLVAGCAPRIVEVTKIVKEVIQETVEVEKVVEKVVKETVEVEVVKPAVKPSGKVIFWGHDDHPHDLAATGFVEKYPDVEFVSPHPADRGAKLRAAFAAGTGCPDLYWAEASEAQDFACSDLLTDLTEELIEEKDHYHPLKWNETVLPKDGKNYGWPGDISVSGWYYRADILEKLGYGDIDFDTWTWDDFIIMSSELAKQGKYTCILPASGWYLGVPFQFQMHLRGGSLVSKDGQEVTIDNEIGLAAFTTIKQIYDTGAALDAPWLEPPYYVGMKEDELIGQFAAAWETGFWESNLTVEEGGLGTWRVAKLPAGEGVKYRTAIFGGAMLINPKCSENRDNAILFMRYSLGSLEGAALCGTWGIIPAYHPYLESPLFLKGKTALLGDWLHNEFWAAQERELSLEYVRPAGWDAVNGAVAKVMEEVLAGDLSPEEGVAKADELAKPDFERTYCKS